MKRLAIALGIPLDTARALLYRNYTVAADRLREGAAALLAELDRQERVPRPAARAAGGARGCCPGSH